MKYIRLMIVLAIILIAGAFLWPSGNAGIDSSDKFHKDLYEGASGSWDPTVSIDHFRPQIINGVEFGSSSMMTVKWSQPETSYNHFVLTISDPASDWYKKESGEHDRVSLDIDRLNPGQEYLVVLQACLDPNCEAWHVSETEVSGSPSIMYWQLDGEGSEDTFVPTFYEEDEHDTRPEQPIYLTSDNAVMYWPDGTLVSEETASEYLEGVYDQDIIYADGSMYDRHMTFHARSGNNEAPEPIASATLLNP